MSSKRTSSVLSTSGTLAGLYFAFGLAYGEYRAWHDMGWISIISPATHFYAFWYGLAWPWALRPPGGNASFSGEPRESKPEDRFRFKASSSSDELSEEETDAEAADRYSAFLNVNFGQEDWRALDATKNIIAAQRATKQQHTELHKLLDAMGPDKKALVLRLLRMPFYRFSLLYRDMAASVALHAPIQSADRVDAERQMRKWGQLSGESAEATRLAVASVAFGRPYAPPSGERQIVLTRTPAETMRKMQEAILVFIDRLFDPRPLTDDLVPLLPIIPGGDAWLSSLEEACAKGSGDDCYELGRVKLDGVLSETEPIAAQAAFERGCTLGTAPACFELANALYDGSPDATAEKRLQAEHLHTRACEAGFGPACSSLGFVEQETGRKELALAHYSLSCDRGVGLGCYNAGLGQLAKDEAFARRLFAMGCDAGDEHSCSKLGDILATSESADGRQQSRRYNRRACLWGWAIACHNLGVQLAEVKDYVRAGEAFTRACSMGHQEACTNLGWLRAEGLGVERDRTSALSLFDDACKAGVRSACERARALRQ